MFLSQRALHLNLSGFPYTPAEQRNCLCPALEALSFLPAVFRVLCAFLFFHKNIIHYSALNITIIHSLFSYNAHFLL